MEQTHTSPTHRRGVATIEVSGHMRAADLSALRAKCFAATGGSHRALVFDCRNAVLQKGDVVVAQQVLRAPPHDDLPVAIVCAARDEPAFIAHAWRMAKSGRMRAVFTRMNDAVVWARARAQMVGQV